MQAIPGDLEAPRPPDTSNQDAELAEDIGTKGFGTGFVGLGTASPTFNSNFGTGFFNQVSGFNPLNVNFNPTAFDSGFVSSTSPTSSAGSPTGTV